MSHEELEAALVAYIGRGRSPFPTLSSEAVLTRFGSAGSGLLEQVEALVEESLRIPIDWNVTTLGDAGRHVARVLHERHPELGHDARDALAWNFTYAMR